MPVVTMMPPVMRAPVMTVPVPVVADAARAVIGVDDTAAAIGIVIGRRVGRSVVAAIAVEVPAVMVEVRPIAVMRAMMIAAAVEHRSRASAVKRRAATVEHGTWTAPERVTTSAMERRSAAASEHGAATVEGRSTAAAVKGRACAEAATAATMEAATSTAMEAAAMMSATAAMTTRAGATHLNGQSVRRRLCRRSGAWRYWRHG